MPASQPRRRTVASGSGSSPALPGPCCNVLVTRALFRARRVENGVLHMRSEYSMLAGLRCLIRILEEGTCGIRSLQSLLGSLPEASTRPLSQGQSLQQPGRLGFNLKTTARGLESKDIKGFVRPSENGPHFESSPKICGKESRGGIWEFGQQAQQMLLVA